MSHSEWKHQTARKPHRCLWCGTRIEKGEMYARERYVDGSFHGSNAWHLECEDAMNKAPVDLLWDWIDEGCVPDFKRGSLEMMS